MQLISPLLINRHVFLYAMDPLKHALNGTYIFDYIYFYLIQFNIEYKQVPSLK